MRFDTGITDVPTSGTAVQVENIADGVLWIKFTAPATNSGVTYVGLSDVSSTNGYPLGSSGGVDATLELNFGAHDGSVKMSDFYLDSATNGDDVARMVIFQ